MSEEDRSGDSLENTPSAESDDHGTASEAETAEARRKDAQEYARQLSEQLKESSQQIANLEGRVEELSRSKAEPQNEEPPENIFDIGEEQMDEFRDDPAKIIGFVEDKVFSTVANAFVNSNQQTAAKMRQLEGMIDNMSPEKWGWSEKIEELRASKPAYSDLSDEAAREILKEKGSEPAFSYSGGGGSPRGGGATLKESDLKPSKDEYKGIMSSFLALCGGDEKKAKARADRFIEQKQAEAKAGARL